MKYQVILVASLLEPDIISMITYREAILMHLWFYILLSFERSSIYKGYCVNVNVNVNVNGNLYTNYK